MTQLVGNREFSEFQNEIIERLIKVNGLPLEGFKKVHSGCGVTALVMREASGSGSTEFGDFPFKVQIQRLSCEKHKVKSVEFFNYLGTTTEGPF